MVQRPSTVHFFPTFLTGGIREVKDAEDRFQTLLGYVEVAGKFQSSYIHQLSRVGVPWYLKMLRHSYLFLKGLALITSRIISLNAPQDPSFTVGRYFTDTFALDVLLFIEAHFIRGPLLSLSTTISGSGK